MRDIFDQMNANDLETLSKKRKVNKGSKLARHSLSEALGGADGYYDDRNAFDATEFNIDSLDAVKDEY